MIRRCATLFVLLLTLSPLTRHEAAAQVSAPAGIVSGKDAPIPAGRHGPKKEVVSLRTRTSRTYEQDGVYSGQFYPGSINYQDRQGAWQPIDDTLIASDTPGFSRQNKANRYTARFPSDLGKGPIRIDLKPGWIEFSLHGGSGPGTASAETETYPISGGSIAYTTGNDETKETISLDGPNAPHTFVYDLKTSPTLTAEQNKAGGIDFVDKTGAVQLAFATPFMYEKGATADAVSHAVTLKLDQTSTGQTVTLAADPQWLTAPGRKWPVTIDPTITYNPTSSANQSPDMDCMIESGNPNTYCGANYDDVGQLSSTVTDRGLLHFSLNITQSQEVLNAYLSEYLWDTSRLTTPTTTINLHPLTNPWSTCCVNWTSRDGATNWNSAGGDYDSGVAASATVSQNQASGWVTWSPTQLVQDWVSGGRQNYGLMLKAASEGAQNNLVQFYSAHYVTSTYWPFLYVTFANRSGSRAFYTMPGQRIDDHMGMQVNVTNGNLLIHASDVSTPGIGLPMHIDRYWNSLLQFWTAGAMGDGWLGNVGTAVYLDFFADGSVEYWGPSGVPLGFTKQGDGSFASPPGIDARLVKNPDGSYTLTFNQSQEQYNFGSSGVLYSDVDRAGNALRFSYWGAGTIAGRLAQVEDSQGRWWNTISYNSGNQISQIQDPAGRLYQYGYDASYTHLLTYTDPWNKVTQFKYSDGTDGNPTDELTQITDPNGNVTKFSYLWPAGLPPEVSSISRVTNTTTYTTSFAYNTGNTVVTDSNNHATTYYYDGYGRVTSVKDAEGHTAQRSWTADDNPDTTTLPSGDTSKRWYDGLNNPYQADVHPTSGTTVSTKSAFQNSSFPYNASSSTDAQGNTTTYGYNGQGLLNTARDAAGNLTQTSYNPNGTVSSVTDANNHVTSYTYYSSGTSVGLLSGMTPPAPRGAESYTYNSYNLLASRQDGKGQTTTYTYDPLGRVTGIAYADGSSVGYSYDADGNLISEADSTGTSTYTYNQLNQLIQEQHPGGVSVTYTYDGEDNLLTKTDSGGQVSYGYWPTNRLQTVTDPQNAQTSFTYDVDGNLTQTSYPNGVSEHQQYDQAGELTRIWATNSGGTLTSYTYGYTNPSTGLPTMQRYSVTDVNGSTTNYTYDSLNELKTAGSPTASYAYSYDPVGNMTSKTINGVQTSMSFNSADELTSAGSTTYTYDLNGNQTGVSSGNSFTYNAKDQTSSITPAGSGAISMAYRGTGQAQRITAGGTSYQYDATGLSQSSSGSPAYYTTTPGGAVVSERLSSGKYYYLHDGLGSVVMLTNSGGGTANTYSYDSYGNTTSASEPVSNPFRYVGAVWDSQAHLYKMGARYYDPSVGRFTQTDPAKCSSGTRAGEYSYAGDDPINLSDQSGLFPNPFGWLRDRLCAACHKQAQVYDELGLVGEKGCRIAATIACTAMFHSFPGPFAGECAKILQLGCHVVRSILVKFVDLDTKLCVNILRCPDQG